MFQAAVITTASASRCRCTNDLVTDLPYLPILQVDGHTSASEWPQYGITVARNAVNDKSGYFVIGALPHLLIDARCCACTAAGVQLLSCKLRWRHSRFGSAGSGLSH